MPGSPSFYQQYRYRIETLLNNPEAKFLRGVKREEGKTYSTELNIDKQGQLSVEDPVINGYMQVGYYRQMMMIITSKKKYPDISDIHQKYPGVDPLNNHCDIDMAFSQRMADIRASMPFCRRENSEILQTLLDQFGKNEQKPASQLYSQMKKDCQSIRAAQMASKLCPNEQASNLLEDGMKEIERNSRAIQMFDYVLKGMEQIVGLREGPMENSMKSALMGMMAFTGKQLPEDISVGQNARNPLGVGPEELKVEIPSVTNVILQNLYTKLENWEKPTKDVWESNQQADFLPEVNATVVGAAGRTLKAIYSAMPDKSVDPMSLVMVDGKPLNVHIADQFHTEQKVDNRLNFREWFQANGARVGSQVLAAGLMANMRIEAFVPDANGKLPDQPLRITRTGHEPSPRTPVVLNAWERFFSKFGFYKDKVKQAEDYQRYAESRAQLKQNYVLQKLSRENNMGNPNLKALFFQEAVKGMGASSLEQLQKTKPSKNSIFNIKLARSSASSLVACYLAAEKKMTIEQIMDPNYKPELKKEAGKLVLEKLSMDPETGKMGESKERRIGDNRWIAENFIKGQTILMNELNKLTKGVDLHNTQEYLKIAPKFMALRSILFDVTQDQENIRTDYAETGKRLLGEKGFEALKTKAFNATNAAKIIQQYHSAKYSLGSAMTEIAASTGLGDLAAGEKLFADLAKGKGSFVDRCPDGLKLSMFVNQAKNHQNIKFIAGKIVNNPQFRDEFIQTATKPEFLQNFTVKGDELDVSLPSKLYNLAFPPQRQQEAAPRTPQPAAPQR